MQGQSSVGLSEDEVTQAAELLSRLQPGFLPFKIFHQVTRLVATPIVEIVPLRFTQPNKVEILLLQREADDPAWPGQWHVPGTVIRATDTSGSFDDALQRILSQELGGTKTSKLSFVTSILHLQNRGMEASQIFWVEIDGEPGEGQLYDVDHLPATIVKTQLDFIPDAIAHFKDAKA